MKVVTLADLGCNSWNTCITGIDVDKTDKMKVAMIVTVDLIKMKDVIVVTLVLIYKAILCSTLYIRLLRSWWIGNINIVRRYKMAVEMLKIAVRFCKIRPSYFFCNEFLVKMYRLLQNYTFEICTLSKIVNICC